MITKVVANLNGSEFGPVSGSTLRQQIRSFYASIGGIAKSSFGDVLLDDKSVKNDLGHPNYRNKTCSFAAVKDVLENGIETKPMAYYGVHGKKQETGVISANIMIKGQPFRMDVVVIKNEDEVLRVRCHDVYQTTLAENHQKGLITKRIRRTLIESPSCCPNGDSSAKVEQIIETTKDNNIKTKKYTYMNNKKQIRLTESDLHNIVKESVSKILSEAYGTMPHNDLLMHYDYSPYEDKSLDANLHDTDYHKKGDIPRYYNWVPDLAKAYGEFKRVANEAYPYSYVGERYMKKLRKELHNIEDILNRVIKIEKMDLGLDPYSPNVRNDRNYTKPKEGYILNPNRWYQNQSDTIPNPNHPPKS